MGVVFNQMLARYRKTKKAAAKAQAAGEARDSAKLAIAEAIKMPATLQAVKVLLKTLDSLTPRMKNLLERHAANNDGRIIRFRDPTSEELQRAEFMGAPKPTTFREEIAIINEVKAVAPNSRADFVAEKRIPWAVAELTAMVDDMAVDADAIVAKTRALRDTRDLLDHSIERAARFFVPSNIAKLGYLEDVNAPRRVTFDVGPPPRLVVE